MSTDALSLGGRLPLLRPAEEEHTSLDARVRQVVILTVGAVWKADYELYAHAAVARKAGLSDGVISQLSVGLAAAELSEAEKIAQRFVVELIASHRIDNALFGAAKEHFGLKGFVELVNLVGAYQTVCGLLNAFAVPAPEVATLQPLGQTPGDNIMPLNVKPKVQPKVQLSIAAQFPPHFFLENIAVRHDNSLLITVVTRKELYYLAPHRAGEQAAPVLLHTFGELTTGIAELEPDIFVVISGNAYTTHETYLHRLDLRDWKPGTPVAPELILTFPKEILSLNGCCALSPTTVLAADSFVGAIWRIDLDAEARAARAKLWLKHYSMAHIKDNLPPPPQPGINGLRYSAAAGYAYYTTTGQKLFMRVRIDPTTLDPAGEPERIAAGGMYDDLCLDEVRGAAYVTVHRENRIDYIPLEPDAKSMRPLAGVPLDEMLLGPSSAAWGRALDEVGRVVYVTTDGGQTAPPPDGIVRNAKVLRMQLT